MKNYQKTVNQGTATLFNHIKIYLPMYKFLIGMAKEKQIENIEE